MLGNILKKHRSISESVLQIFIELNVKNSPNLQFACFLNVYIMGKVLKCIHFSR